MSLIFSSTPPFQPEYDATENDVDYVVGQFKDMIRRLEEFCGKPFDYEKFSRVMRDIEKGRRLLEAGDRLCAAHAKPHGRL